MSFRLSRRGLIAAAGLWGVAPFGFAKPNETHSDNRLWYQQPAARWEEALPLGNGRLGAMVFGSVAQERLQLNEDTVWAGSPYTPDNPEALAALPEIRRLIAEGRYAEAETLASARIMARPLRQMPYGTLGDLLLNFDGAAKPLAYVRDLDLETAVATTDLRTPAGAFRREAFVSAADQVMAVRLTAASGRIGFSVAWRGPQTAEYVSPSYRGPATEATPPVPDWLAAEAAGPLPVGAAAVADGDGAWLITGHNEAYQDVATGLTIPSGLTYAIRIKIMTDGEVRMADGGPVVQGPRPSPCWWPRRPAMSIIMTSAAIRWRSSGGRPRRRRRNPMTSSSAIMSRTIAPSMTRFRSIWAGHRRASSRPTSASPPTARTIRR